MWKYNLDHIMHKSKPLSLKALQKLFVVFIFHRHLLSNVQSNQTEIWCTRAYKISIM